MNTVLEFKIEAGSEWLIFQTDDQSMKAKILLGIENTGLSDFSVDFAGSDGISHILAPKQAKFIAGSATGVQITATGNTAVEGKAYVSIIDLS